MRFPRALRGPDPGALFEIKKPSAINIGFLPDGNFQISVVTLGTPCESQGG
jgi:hypothetical protein